jgi:putative ABC transport system ATP-binding protein
VSALIEVRDLRFGWSAARTDIDIEALDVERGARVFVQGASGSGKSTLLSLLAGVNVPRSGTVRVLGNDLATLSSGRRDRFRAEHIGFVFQQFNLLPYLNAIDNVVLGLRFSRERAARVANPGAAARTLLQRLGLGAVEIESLAAALSVGQQQRVAAARALIGAPELLIADEPTSALDADTRDQFVQLLLSASGEAGSAVLFVSHDASLRPHFDSAWHLHTLNRAASRAA